MDSNLSEKRSRSVHCDGNKIRALRKQEGWTQVELAMLAGVGQKTVWRIENSSPVQPSSVKAVAAALNCEFKNLLQDQYLTITEKVEVSEFVQLPMDEQTADQIKRLLQTSSSIILLNR